MLWLKLDGTAELTTEQRLAIKAAQRGNWKPADTLELERLRALVKPHGGRRQALGLAGTLRPVKILRSWGPNAEHCAKWELDRLCGACEGTGQTDYDFDGEFERDVCTHCGGEGTEPGWLITDLDGLILEDSLP